MHKKFRNYIYNIYLVICLQNEHFGQIMYTHINTNPKIHTNKQTYVIHSCTQKHLHKTLDKRTRVEGES